MKIEDSYSYEKARQFEARFDRDRISSGGKDHADVRTIVENLGFAFDRRVSVETLNIYSKILLETLSVSQIREAANKAVKECQFMPKIADLLNRAPKQTREKSIVSCASCGGLGVVVVRVCDPRDLGDPLRNKHGINETYRCTCENSKSYPSVPKYRGRTLWNKEKEFGTQPETKNERAGRTR